MKLLKSEITGSSALCEFDAIRNYRKTRGAAVKLRPKGYEVLLALVSQCGVPKVRTTNVFLPLSSSVP